MKISLGERVCAWFIKFIIVATVVVAFFASTSRSAHAEELVSTEEVSLGGTYLHEVVTCDKVEQVVAQARELHEAIQAERPVTQLEGCGMMMGGIPALVFTIGTLIVGDIELTVVRFETVSRYGNQYGWLANVRQITSL